MKTRTLQLRTRLAIAGTLLIATTLAIGVWSAVSFRDVSRVVGDTIADDEGTTNATTKLAETLEREDDAVLLALTDQTRGRAELALRRDDVASALKRVVAELDAPDEQEISKQVVANIAAYHSVGDELVAQANAPDARTRYHEIVNPALRRAIATINTTRDNHFRSSQAIAEWARDRATRSMQIVAVLSTVTLLLLIAVVLHLARVLMRPVGELTRAVTAMRRGDFSKRVAVMREDELGRLGAGFNRMADELEEFRRANIGEVIRAKETLEATLEALPDAVIVVEPDRKLSARNAQALAAFGAQERLDELPVAAREAVDAVLRLGMPQNAAVDLSKAIDVPIDGRLRKLLARTVPIEGNRGAVLVLSDVTDLVRLDEMRLELVAVASHELRTPLTTMGMTLSMMKERVGGYGARDRELVTTAAMGVEQLTVLVNEFLDLTQIEAGQLRLHWSRVPLGDLVRQCARTVAAACDGARITLDISVADDLPPSIAADRARLAMVVTNLLANAVKYTPSGGRIALSVALEGDRKHAMIEVADSGPGVPVEYRERVFERFFRVEHARGGDVGAGVGIGLYIARQITEAHGGRIHCDDSDAGGARFVITVPTESERNAALQ
jgi:NtrC-family two-component system sensor histidine kinase KinB